VGRLLKPTWEIAGKLLKQKGRGRDLIIVGIFLLVLDEVFRIVGEVLKLGTSSPAFLILGIVAVIVGIAVYAVGGDQK